MSALFGGGGGATDNSAAIIAKQNKQKQQAALAKRKQQNSYSNALGAANNVNFQDMNSMMQSNASLLGGSSTNQNNLLG